jgi:neutral ceramidase
VKWRQPLEVEVQALRIGDMAIVAMPGEPFAEIGAAVKKSSPFPVTMFCGYSSGKGGGYMPVASEYTYGGYEVERTPYGTGAAQAVVDAASTLLEKLR